ncbi:hypothetical protein EXN66_Car005117 [Channa argus]|uniref:Uncharacterized protein n=1 Tax=Channa argus TaxID=215402 RepID=A0A6G1PGP2_CHAAH|nr:hypothetical protein EXN66_Car005117 [Channa argus]
MSPSAPVLRLCDLITHACLINSHQGRLSPPSTAVTPAVTTLRDPRATADRPKASKPSRGWGGKTVACVAATSHC